MAARSWNTSAFLLNPREEPVSSRCTLKAPAASAHPTTHGAAGIDGRVVVGLDHVLRDVGLAGLDFDIGRKGQQVTLGTELEVLEDPVHIGVLRAGQALIETANVARRNHVPSP